MTACSCPQGCRSRETMRLRHGTPEAFANNVEAAIGEISIAEARAAIERYRREYADAPATESLADVLGDP